MVKEGGAPISGGVFARMPVLPLSALGMLAASAFLSATLLPGSSEAVLVGLLASGMGQPAQLIAAASLGNVAGATLNWVLGRFFSSYQDRSWFPVSGDAGERARRWFGRYGVWSLLFSWVPVIGDPLTLIAGILRVDLPRFLILVSIGKVARYAGIVLAWQLLQTG
jgi:membrane protein YqaA with SNARE-associated domain